MIFFSKHTKAKMKKWHRWGAFILLITTLASSAVPIGASAAVTERATLLILGDSIATGHSLEDYNSAGNPKSQYSWATLLAEEYGAKQVNLAVDGDTTSDLLAVVQANAKRPAIASADVICISIGGNNFLQLMGRLFAQESLFTPDAVDSAYAEVQALAQQDLDDIFAALQGVNPDAKILIQTLLAPYRYFAVEIGNGQTVADWMGTYVDRYNEMLKERANEYGVTVIDVEHTFRERGQESWLYASMSEGTLSEAIMALSQANPHPTKEGHQAIFETYCETAEEILRQALAAKPVTIPSEEETQSAQTEDGVMTEEETVQSAVTEDQSDVPPTEKGRTKGRTVALAAGIGAAVAAAVGACAIVMSKKKKK